MQFLEMMGSDWSLKTDADLAERFHLDIQFPELEHDKRKRRKDDKARIEQQREDLLD
jgi:hypothetical protein